MLKSDKWIKKMAKDYKMIDPFEEKQIKQGVISYGISSYGYDIRLADEFKIFTNVFNSIVDPKNFDPKSFVDFKGKVCVIPPNSFILGRSIEYLKIPRKVLGICLGKSTYARCGIIVNITPLEPCYDKDTEIMTSNGWKKFEDLKDDEVVATLNPDTYELEYQKITRRQKFRYNGELIHIKGRQIDLLVTPEHRLFVKNRYRENFEFIEAGKLFGKYNYEMKRDFIWKGKDIKFFKIPSIKNNKYIREGEIVGRIINQLKENDLKTLELTEKLQDIPYETIRHSLKVLLEENVVTKKGIYLKGKRHTGANKNNIWILINKNYEFNLDKMELPPIEMDLWVKFLGFWLAEGSAYISQDGDYIVKLANFDKKILNEVENWLKKLPFNYFRTETGFTIINKPLCSYLMQFGHAREKYIPEFVKQLPPEQIKQFLYGFMLGDGNSETETYTTSSKKMADDLQELIFKCGWASIIRTINVKPHKIKGREIKSNGFVYRIRISKKMLTPKIYPRSFKKVKYDGFVYDVTVPNHTLFVRRNGKPVWSSNCWEGQITIEISNTTPLPVKVYANEGIAQILFLESDEDCEFSYKDKKGKYDKQEGIVLPKIEK